MSKRKYTDEEFTRMVRVSTSTRQVLIGLGLKGAGGNYALAKRRIQDLGLDTSHFTGQGYLKGKHHNWGTKIPLSDILVENSTFLQTSKLREKLFRDGLFERVCQSCGCDRWMDNPIPLELEHTNGRPSDNRIENLKILCPNCHALTSTYRGKNIGKH